MPVPVFVGFEVVGHPMPDRAHRSPVAVGGGVLVVEGGEGESVDEGKHNTPRTQSSEVVVKESGVVGGGSVDDGEGLGWVTV